MPAGALQRPQDIQTFPRDIFSANFILSQTPVMPRPDNVVARGTLPSNSQPGRFSALQQNGQSSWFQDISAPFGHGIVTPSIEHTSIDHQLDLSSPILDQDPAVLNVDDFHALLTDDDQEQITFEGLYGFDVMGQGWRNSMLGLPNSIVPEPTDSSAIDNALTCPPINTEEGECMVQWSEVMKKAPTLDCSFDLTHHLYEFHTCASQYCASY